MVPALAVETGPSTDPHSAATSLPTTMAVPTVTEPPTPASESDSDPRSGVAGELIKELVLTVLVLAPRTGSSSSARATGLRTPEGVGAAARRRSAVYSVYGTARRLWTSARSTFRCPATMPASYVFYIGAEGTVIGLWLRRGATLDCG